MSLPRRAVPGLLAVAAVALAGCDLLPEAEPASVPPPTADELLVDSIATAVLGARDLAAASVTVGGWSYVVLHEAHLAALGRPAASVLPVTQAASPSGTPATSPASPTPAPAPPELVTAEKALQTTLVDGAVAAEDGGLARLLGSMSAAIAQLLAEPAT